MLIEHYVQKMADVVVVRVPGANNLQTGRVVNVLAVKFWLLIFPPIPYCVKNCQKVICTLSLCLCASLPALRA